MSDLDRRWRRLVAASRRSPPAEPPPPSPALVDRLALRGLDARIRRPEARRAEPWAWAALASLASVGVLLLLLARPPLQHEAAMLVQDIARLPGHVPPAPALPPPFTVPPAREALALLPDGAGVRAALGLPPFPEDTP